MGIGPHAGHMLRLFGAHIAQAWGETPYQVGSSLTQKGGWRDVDVRLILDDEAFAERFPGIAGSRVRKAHELAWTVFGEHLTGLPIDFQIQMQSEANAEFEGPRSALLIYDTDLPFVRTGQHA